MDITKYYAKNGEKPLDNIVDDGGMCAIFRTIGCIGDSLASGEFESLDANNEKGFHDYFEYSWGQYIARMTGAKVYNFSRGGMTAKEYCNSFASANNFWSPTLLCQAYVIALGVNDITSCVAGNMTFGDMSDIDFDDPEKCKETFTGYYAKIILKLKKMQPKAKFFLMTRPTDHAMPEEKKVLSDKHSEFLHALAEKLDYTYVLDFRKYAPVYDDEFRKNFYLGGHMSPAGYLITAKMTASYIDYIIRNNPEDFAQVGFIGTDFHNKDVKW